MYLIIDESGNFQKRNSGSIVCGWLTSRSMIQMEESLKQILWAANLPIRTNTVFFHARLLKNRIRNDRDYNGVIPFLELSESQAQLLFDSSMQYVLENGTIFESSLRDYKEAGTDPQQNYVIALRGLLRLVQTLLLNENLASKISVLIAGRKPELYPLKAGQSPDDYENLLRQDLCAEFPLIDEITIIRANSHNAKKLVTSTADFACWYCREQVENYTPEPQIIREIQRQSMDQLPIFDQIRFSTRDKLETLVQSRFPESDTSEASLDSLIDIADSLVLYRETNPTALEKAQSLYTLVTLRAQKAMIAEPGSRLPQWIKAQKGTISIENHRGLVGQQRSRSLVVQRFTSAIHLREIPLSHKMLLMDLQLHAWNYDFNNFEFQGILDQFHSEGFQILADPERKYPADIRMRVSGTLGQALAFLENDHEKACNHFLASLAESNSCNPIFDNMSHNYLACTHWSMGKLGEMIKDLSAMPEFSEALTKRTIPEKAKLAACYDKLLPNHLHTEHLTLSWHFNLLNILRAYSLCEPPKFEQLESLLRVCSRRGLVTNHPSQLILKWLAFHLIHLGKTDHAMDCLDNALEICFATEASGPTIQATGLPMIGMKIALEGKADQLFHTEILERTNQLCASLSGLESYLNRKNPDGWMLQWITDIRKQNYFAIAKWMPWAYA